MRLPEGWRDIFGGKNLTRRQKIVQLISMAMLLYSGVFVGYVYGYVEGTGTMPFGPKGESIVPPELTKTTSNKVVEFVKNDMTDLEQYRHGFNCVEFALLAARNAWWEGVPSVPVRIDFEGGGSHLILGFPTEDKGWMMLNPEGDLFIKPRVGGKFLDKRIMGIFYLHDLVWRPVEEAER